MDSKSAPKCPFSGKAASPSAKCPFMTKQAALAMSPASGQVQTPKLTAVNEDALRSEIRAAIITQKANACPIVVRLAWHASGTYSKEDKTGGSNGATMRFAPESEDGANAGLSIVRDLLEPVKQRHPEISYADLWQFAGICAIEFMGGPRIPMTWGRTDAPSGSHCPVVGRLPDASQGARHLREVFYRMGFDDREIVCLSGAHTLGSCHSARSGYTGPWTHNPLRFDNLYFVNLMNLEWVPKKWDGPLQFEDTATGKLMMLPTDMALVQDPKFRKYVEMYAADQDLFFRDFSVVFKKLIDNNVPFPEEKKVSAKERNEAEFLRLAMHGEVGFAKALKDKGVSPAAVEANSGRTALHKAAFWGHNAMIQYLLTECKLNPNVRDFAGDTPLHDAARFGHETVVQHLLGAGADPFVRNNQGLDSIAVALEYKKDGVVKLLKGAAASRAKL